LFQKELNGVIEHLKNQELQKPFIKTLIQLLKKDKNLLAVSNLEEYIISSLSSMVMTENFEVKKNNLPKVVSFVGPTGVGKTTSIAKLAAISKIIHNLNVGIISIDSYRLGAIDQLRIFSEISNIDMLVAYEPGDMKEQLKKLKNKDIVFIDTIGRSHKNTQELRKIKKFLDGIKVDETLLVLSSTSSTKYLYEAAEKFKVLDYSSLVFTKLDEASSFGNLFNVSINYDTPIQFLTNGQIIPDDILSADPDFIAKIIYTGAIN
jgi:flagellar biosynthesis protein FlhF